MKYFAVSDEDMRMVAWGEEGNVLEALPIVLCPQVVPTEIMDKFCNILTESDPEGKIGKDLTAFVEAQLKAFENSPEMQGLKAGDVPEELTKDDNN